MKTFLEFYNENGERLKRKIERFNDELIKEDKPLLLPFMKNFADLNEGGKMLRGTLVNMGYALTLEPELLGVDMKEDRHLYGESDALALAFEIFQTSVLMHDDVIDHAALRRGKPTVHTRYRRSLWNRGIEDKAGDTPQSVAICLGDFGLYAASDVIVKSYAHDPTLSDILEYFNGVVMDTIRGELLDVILPYEGADLTRDQDEREKLVLDSVREVYRLKTAKYSIVGPLHLGLIYGGADEETLKKVDAFAESLGIAFQIKDDIFGVYGGEEIGKDVGSDIEEAKMTILYNFVRAKDERLHRELMQYYGKSPATADAIAKVQNIFTESGALEYATTTMEKCFDDAKKAVEEMDFCKEKKELLGGLISYMRERTK